MNDVIIVTGCTHRAGLLDAYERTLQERNIPFHLEQLEPMPDGANSITMSRRINYWRKMALQFKEYKAVYITDAWDVMFFGAFEELKEKAPGSLIISAERNCYPEPQLASAIYGSTPWKYANNGMIAANPEYLLEWLDKAQSKGDLDILDQAWFNRRLRDCGHDLIPLDATTDLFYVVSAHLEDGALQVRNNRPWNSHCDTYPMFLHFSGHCPLKMWEQLL